MSSFVIWVMVLPLVLLCIINYVLVGEVASELVALDFTHGILHRVCVVSEFVPWMRIRSSNFEDFFS